MNPRLPHGTASSVRLEPGDDPQDRRPEPAGIDLLVRAGEVLGASLDVASNLARLAALLVPAVADSCLVDLADDAGDLRRVVVHYSDPGRCAAAEELRRRYPPRDEGERGPAAVVRRGRPQIMRTVHPAAATAGAVDDHHRRLLAQVASRSAVILPLRARDRVLGAMTLGFAESGREYGDSLVALASAVADRAALAIDNATLHSDLDAAHQRFRGLVEDVDAIVWEADAETMMFSFVSRRAEAILGYPVARWLNDASFWPGIIHPDDRSWAVAYCREASDRGADHDFEYRATAADGRTVWLRDYVRVVDDPRAGRILRGVMVDVTEEKRAEAALRSSEERFRTLFESAHDIVFVHDLAGRFLAVNEAAERATGYRKGDALRMNVRDVVAPEHLERVERLIAQAIAGRGEGTPFELDLLARDGRRIPVEISARVFTQDGRVRAVQGIARDVSDRRRQVQELLYQTLHDPLTDLPNRSALTEELAEVLGRWERGGVVVLDLDRFGAINDALGHDRGDALLREVARRLGDGVGAGGFVARIGGNEFALLVRGGPDEVVAGAERLLDTLRKPFYLDGLFLDVRAAAGAAVFPASGQTPLQLLRSAAVALARSKRTLEPVVLYDRRIDRGAKASPALLADLRRALERDELVLRYQPKVSLETGELCGLEALVRWQHPRLGLLMPDAFVGAAEQTGAIRRLDRWVLRAALRQAVAWRTAGSVLPVAVNVSARTLDDPRFPGDVAALIAAENARPTDITIEITESALMEEPERTRPVVEALRGAGVEVSLDDFGTGFSSLAQLRDVPLDEIKLDRRFVTHLEAGNGDAAIVRAVIELSADLGLRIVAEGIESKAVVDLLRRLGCRMGQGFYLGRPMPPEAFEAALVPPFGEDDLGGR